MLKQLYERRLWEIRTEPKKQNFLTFGDGADELKWIDPLGYNRKNFPIVTPYGNVYDNSYHSVLTYQNQLHGDFRSSYSYHRAWRLDKGGGGVGFNFSRPPSAPSQKSIYRCTAPQALWVGGHANGVPVLTDVMNRAQLALTQKLTRDLPSWDILTDFAELGETLGFTKEATKRVTDVVAGCLLRNPRRVLRGFMVDPTKKRVRHVKSVLDHHYSNNADASIATAKAAGSLWLSYRYGLMPLLYSTEDAIKALSFSGKDSTIETEAQVTFKQYYKLADVTSDTFDTAYTFWVTVRQYHVGRFSYRLKAKMSWKDSFKDRLRLNPIQQLTTAWEVVPFSFVIDWFYDVNTWLTRLQINTLAAKMTINGTLIDQCFAGESILGVRPTATDGKTAYSSSYLGKPPASETRTFRRYANVSLSINPPSIENGLDRFKRYMDSISLATNFLKSPSLRKIPR